MDKQKILIVDDNPLNIQALVYILQPEYECVVAKSGTDALDAAREFLPDIILLDILMPDIDGYEVLTILKKWESTRHIPVICVTGLGDGDSEERGLALGAADYIHRANSAAVIKLRVRKQLELINALKVAEDANHAKSDFLAKMSHEIRTPLNSVIGITNIALQKSGHPLETEEAFLQIRSSSDILLAIINDILDLSKVEAGKMPVFPKPYDTVALISDTIQLNIAHIGRKDIDFKMEIDKNLPSMLIGDEIRIKQILNNLLSNAFKYTDMGGVKLAVRFEKPKTLSFIVSDTGQGMSKEQMKNIFGKYTRVNEAKNRHIQGTGLGLNIAHRLVEAMDGVIFVESTPGKGSVFRVKLPQQIEDKTVIGKEQAENLQSFKFSRSEMKKKHYFEYEPMPYGKILVVDDIESNLFVAKGLLEPYSLTVETASGGTEAFSLVKSGKIYDIIFMDHMMPGVDGVAATKAIRDTGYVKPIVALTANVAAAHSDAFAECNFDGFIAKPIDVNILHSYLVRLIRDKYPEDVVRIARLSGNVKPRNISDGVLEAFLGDATRIKDLLSEFINKNNGAGDLEFFTVNMHGIRSGLANIGRAKLAGDAARLEEAGRNADRRTIREETPHFVNELALLIDELSPLEVQQTGEDADLLHEGLKAIHTVCEKRNLIDARDVLYELGKYTWTPETKDFLGRLSARLLHSEFADAVSEIEVFLEREMSFLYENLAQIAAACESLNDSLAYEILDQLNGHSLTSKVKLAIKSINKHLLHGNYEKAAEVAKNIRGEP